MNEHPLISIVTVCLNSAKTISTTIESVLNQTYSNWEYIIKDGGSSDETIDIINSYKDRFGGRLRIIQEKDHGIYDAMNQGVSECRGEMIGIINSDDYYSPNTLELVAEEYARRKKPTLVIIGDMERVSEKGELIYRYHFTQDMVEKKLCFGHPAMFASKKTYDRIGLYDTSYKLAADGDWQYRAMDDEEVLVVLVPRVFNHMREGGASDNRKLRWKWFSERIRLQNTYRKAPKFIILIKELKKVLVTDIKSIIPDNLKSKLYKVRYRKQERKR